MKHHIQILTVILFALSHTVWSAEIYKWVDADGNVHFSDQPGDSKSQRVDVPKFKTDPVLEQRQQEREDLKEKQKAESDITAVDAEAAQKEEEQRKKNCVTARERVEQIQTVRRLFRIDESGERHDLSDEERAAALKKARDDVEKWCE